LFQIDPNWFQVDPWLIVIVAIGISAFLAITIIWGIRAHRHQASAGREDLIGKTAIVKVALEPEGIVFFKGERWTAVSEKGRVEPGEEVIITKVDGLKLYVAKK
jgi:membrane-bound ClpP family serine protease